MEEVAHAALLPCVYFNPILKHSDKRKKWIFLFFNYEATGPPGAGLPGMDVFIIGRRVDAEFYTWLN